MSVLLVIVGIVLFILIVAYAITAGFNDGYKLGVRHGKEQVEINLSHPDYPLVRIHKLQRRAFIKGWKHARREQVRASGEALSRYPTVSDTPRTTEML